MPVITCVILEIIIHMGTERVGQLGSTVPQVATCQLCGDGAGLRWPCRFVS